MHILRSYGDDFTVSDLIKRSLYLHAVAVGSRPRVPLPRVQEPVVDPHVEEDEGGEGRDPQEDGAGHVHVVLDVNGIVPAGERNK